MIKTMLIDLYRLYTFKPNHTYSRFYEIGLGVLSWLGMGLLIFLAII